MTDRLAVLRETIADRYAIERQIGQGGMAVVFRARDRRHDRSVALKVLRPELATAVGPDRFLREIQIVAALTHPNILTLIDSGEVDGLPFYVMPYVEGESLRDRLDRERQLPLEEAIQITLEVAGALGHAHALGIVHRDVKPENVLLEAGHAVVSDFGIAHAVTEAGAERLTGTGIAIGTPAYMSPEQAAGGVEIDRRADVYSLGCMLYEMLAGEPPFAGPSPSAILAKHVSAPVPSVRIVRPQVPERVERVIQRALAKVPADRFPSCAGLAEALRDAASRPDAQPLPWRRWMGVGLGAAAVVAAVLLSRDGAPAAGPSLARVAVLYLRPQPPSPELEGLADALTELVIDELGQVAALEVLPPGAVQPFRAGAPSLEAVVRTLRAGVVVEGTVDSSSSRLRSTVRIIEGATLRQLASRSLERPVASPEARAELARDLAGFVRARVGLEVRRRRDDREAPSGEVLDLVRRAEELADQAAAIDQLGEPANALRKLEEADSVLQRAAAVAPAWGRIPVDRGWLARTRGLLLLNEARVADAVACFRDGMAHADRALAGQADDAAALELRGTLQMHLAWLGDPGAGARRDSAERDLRRAVALAPHRARAWYYLSSVLQERGLMAEAAVAASRAYREDAFVEEGPPVLQTLHFTALELGWSDSASHWCEEGKRRFPRDVRLAECRLTTLGWYGASRADASAAWRELSAIEAADSTGMLRQSATYRRAMVAAVLARAGLVDSAQAVMARVRRGEQPGEAPLLDYYEAFVRTLAGDHDGALRLLERQLERAPETVDQIATTRWFSSLRADPRFRALVDRTP
jgi:serine/threonine-protein kinase